MACLQADFPDAELALILGSDCLPDFPHWYEPARIIERAELVIANRGSLPTWTSEKLADVLRLPKHIAIRQTVLRIPEIGISGTDIRARVASGRTIRFLTPRAVECYIETHRLYRRSAS
ncbi:MAG: hypothetical protein KatS3mg105_3821 [Gemmatales bacterium]|nr:MAG: hypothetical protein KatS3mg105_3821 [Gemmatales bacterium]